MRSSTAGLLWTALPLLTACAAGGAGDSAAPDALAIRVPDDPTLTYTQADTSVISIDAAGQMMDVPVIATGLLGLSFETADRGVEVTVTWEAFEAEVANPMGAPERASIQDIDGPLVFTLDRRGNAEVRALPALEGNAGRITQPEGVAHGLFPGLPGVPPTPGMTWTDTVSYDSEVPEATSTTRTILEYTVVGDTLVEGTRLLKVAFEGEGSTLQEGSTMGMSFLQDLAGDITGHFLWDLSTGTMHRMASESLFQGTMEISEAPFPLDVAMRSTSTVALVRD